MNIDWSHFTPYSSLAGGILIGLAACLLILADGRIAGISGIVSGLANRDKRERRWRAAFVAGLLISPWLYRLAAPLPEIRYGSHSWILLAIAGLLTGRLLTEARLAGCAIALLTRSAVAGLLTRGTVARLVRTAGRRHLWIVRLVRVLRVVRVGHHTRLQFGITQLYGFNGPQNVPWAVLPVGPPSLCGRRWFARAGTQTYVRSPISL